MPAFAIRCHPGRGPQPLCAAVVGIPRRVHLSLTHIALSVVSIDEKDNGWAMVEAGMEDGGMFVVCCLRTAAAVTASVQIPFDTEQSPLAQVRVTGNTAVDIHGTWTDMHGGLYDGRETHTATDTHTHTEAMDLARMTSYGSGGDDGTDVVRNTKQHHHAHTEASLFQDAREQEEKIYKAENDRNKSKNKNNRRQRIIRDPEEQQQFEKGEKRKSDGNNDNDNDNDDDDDQLRYSFLLQQRRRRGGVRIRDTLIGHGYRVRPGDRVAVQYKGRLNPDESRCFDKTKIGRDFEFVIGSGKVIKGLSIGVVGMSIGGERELVVPPKKGYGKAGRPPKIPGNATLFFDVTLKEVVQKKEEIQKENESKQKAQVEAKQQRKKREAWEKRMAKKWETRPNNQ